MQAALMFITASFFIWDYFFTVPTDDTEFVMTKEYMEMFGGQNFTTKEELRTCIRGNLVTSHIINMKFAIKFRTQLIHSFGVTPFSHS
jgi:hypothetical protein